MWYLLIEFGDGFENDIFVKNNGIVVDYDMIMIYIENMLIFLMKMLMMFFVWIKRMK